MSRPRVAIVGAGLELATDLVALLVDRGIAGDHIHLLDREDTAGETIELEELRCRVEWATPEAVASADFAIFCGRPELARELVPSLRARGGIAIDASGALRDDPQVPLVVPEVNGASLGAVAAGTVLASPSPAAVALSLVLAPLHRAAGIERVVATILGPASQLGAEGIEQLSRQSIQLMQGRGIDRGEFREQLAFNVRPDSPEIEGGWSGAEIGLAQELPRLLDTPGLAVTATVIRVPVFFGSAHAVHADLAREVPLAELETALRGAPGLLLAGSVEDRLAVAVESARRRKERAALAHEEEDDDRDPEEEMIEDGLELEADEEDEEGERDDEDDEEALERRERALEREELRRARESEREREGGAASEGEGEEAPDLLPGPVDVAGSAFVHVARLRLDPERPLRLALWLAFDEIRRGLAMNAIGILELAMRARAGA